MPLLCVSSRLHGILRRRTQLREFHVLCRHYTSSSKERVHCVIAFDSLRNQEKMACSIKENRWQTDPKTSPMQWTNKTKKGMRPSSEKPNSNRKSDGSCSDRQNVRKQRNTALAIMPSLLSMQLSQCIGECMKYGGRGEAYNWRCQRSSRLAPDFKDWVP